MLCNRSCRPFSRVTNVNETAYSLLVISLVTQTHSLHASEGVWWTPASSLVQPIPRIWGALILYWFVVNNYRRGDDCRHYVTKPPLSPFKIKYQFLRNILEYIVGIHCRLLTASKGASFGASRLKSRSLRWWLCDVMAAIITPCAVIYHQSVEHQCSPDSGDRLNKTRCGCSPDPLYNGSGWRN